MATNKRKRAIRALAAERGISYTAAMRLHDADANSPASPTSLFVAGERLPISGPLLVSADPGGGASVLAVSIAVTAAEEGAEVVILGAHDSLVPLSHLADEPSPGRIAGASAAFASAQSRPPQDLIDYLDSEFTRRMTVVAEGGAQDWRSLSQSVRKRERMDHPVLVVEVAGESVGALYRSALLERMRVTCQRLRRQGRAAGFASLSVHVGDMGRTLVAQVQRREFTHAVMGRVSDAEDGTASVVDAFVGEQDRQECLEALPVLRMGQFLVLNGEDGPAVRQVDPEPYLHLFSGNPPR